MGMHTEYALVSMLSHFQPIGICVFLGMFWIQSMRFSSDLMKSNSTWMKASLQQQQVFCLESISTTIGLCISF